MNLKNLSFDKYKLADNSYQIERNMLKKMWAFKTKLHHLLEISNVKIKDKTYKINPIFLKIMKDLIFWKITFLYTEEQRNSSQMAKLILKNLERKKKY